MTYLDPPFRLGEPFDDFAEGAMIQPQRRERCRVYWGSHGCQLPRGHDGDCVCDETCRPTADELADGMFDAGRPPYYGPDTRFYGEDAAARGLPTHPDDDHFHGCPTPTGRPFDCDYCQERARSMSGAE